jgi:hypothetical protein
MVEFRDIISVFDQLTSDQLKQLDLKYGSNEARFSITTRLQVDGHFIFQWIKIINFHRGLRGVPVIFTCINGTNSW